MNWQQFKECVEKAGVKDDTEVVYIDVGYPILTKKGHSMDIRVVTDFEGRTSVKVSD